MPKPASSRQARQLRYSESSEVGGGMGRGISLGEEVTLKPRGPVSDRDIAKVAFIFGLCLYCFLTWLAWYVPETFCLYKIDFYYNIFYYNFYLCIFFQHMKSGPKIELGRAGKI